MFANRTQIQKCILYFEAWSRKVGRAGRVTGTHFYFPSILNHFLYTTPTFCQDSEGQRPNLSAGFWRYYYCCFYPYSSVCTTRRRRILNFLSPTSFQKQSILYARHHSHSYIFSLAFSSYIHLHVHTTYVRRDIHIRNRKLQETSAANTLSILTCALYICTMMKPLRTPYLSFFAFLHSPLAPPPLFSTEERKGQNQDRKQITCHKIDPMLHLRYVPMVQLMCKSTYLYIGLDTISICTVYVFLGT